MVYINNNQKLADLMETLLEPEKVTKVKRDEVNELIIELRSPQGEVHLIDKSLSNSNRY